MVAYRDLSGNNPTHHFLDKPTLRSSPAVEYGTAVDPSSVDRSFSKFARAIYIGTNGNIEVVDQRNNSTVFTGVVAGTILDVQGKGTLAAGTTVTNIAPLF